MRGMHQSAATLAEFHAELSETLAFGPSYPVPSGLMLSNHLPMALHALHRLGAPRAVLERHRKAWTPRLLRVEPGSPVAGAAQASANPYLQALAALQDEAAGREPSTWLGPRLARLLDVPEASAFHGAIRLAHALEGGHGGEILRAVAAWQAARDGRVARQPGGVPIPGWESPARIDIAQALSVARADEAVAFAPRRGTTIVSDMDAAQALPAFDHHAAAFAPTLDQLAEASLAVYLATRDFTALHLVTGTRALRVLLEAVPLDEAVRRRSLARTARAWLAAWVSIGRPEPDFAAVHAGPAGEDAWDAALPRVFASGDDHVIKLADASREEWRRRGWAGYRSCLG